MDALFWLVFKQPKEAVVIIQSAGDIITARMKAMLAGIEGEFKEGHALDAETVRKVPNAQIGKILSRTQATSLLKKLGRGLISAQPRPD